MTSPSSDIQVTSGGLVTSGPRLGSGVVRVEYREGGRREELAVTVEVGCLLRHTYYVSSYPLPTQVREVSYLAVTVEGQGWQGSGLDPHPQHPTLTPPGLESLPRGTSSMLGVSMHDSWGRTFHSQPPVVANRPSR